MPAHFADPLLAAIVTAATFATAASAQTHSFTWTTTADFENTAYRFSNVTASEIPDQLQLDLSQIETPYLWVPNTGSNTVALISTKSQAGLDPGEVIRVANVGGVDPSRTAVDLDFNSWVGFRGGNAVGRLGAADSGLDHLFTNSEYDDPGEQGIAEAWDFVTAVAVNADGNVWVGSQDNTDMRLIEPGSARILNTYGPGLPTYSSAQNFDPTVADESFRPILGGGNVFGFAVDGFGNLWVAQRPNQIGQYDARTGAHIETYSFVFGTSIYGIAVDVNGNVWAGNFSQNGLLFLPRTAAVGGQLGIEECVALAGSACTATAARRIGNDCDSSRGVAIDQAGTAWVNCLIDNTVMRVADDGDGTPVVLGTTLVGVSPVGIAATADGHIWTVNLNGGGLGGSCRGTIHGYTCPNGFAGGTGSTTASNCNLTGGTVARVRASDGVVVATYPTCGNLPEAYSDMAGYTLRSATLRSGVWRGVHDAGLERTGLHWARIDWTGQLPGGTDTPPTTRLQLRLGAADNLTLIDTEALPVVLSVDMADGGVNIDSDLWGRYLAVEVSLQTLSDFTSPVVESITVSSQASPVPAAVPISSNSTYLLAACLLALGTLLLARHSRAAS